MEGIQDDWHRRDPDCRFPRRSRCRRFCKEPLSASRRMVHLRDLCDRTSGICLRNVVFILIPGSF